MSVVVGRLDTEPPGSTGAVPPELPRLITAKRGWFTVVASGTGLDRPFAGATLWAPERRLSDSQVVVLYSRINGVEISEVFAACARTRAAAIVVRDQDAPPDVDLIAASYRTGVPVLTVDDRIEWADIQTLADSIIGASHIGANAAIASATQLYDLAEAAAGALGGSVVFTDADLRVLAYAYPDARDAVTTEMILTRRVPAAWRSQIPRGGGVTAIRDETGQRLASAITAANITLGHVMLTIGTDTPTAVAQLLEEVARAAAPWIVGEENRTDEDMIRSELLRGWLFGTGTLSALSTRLGQTDGADWTLTVLAARSGPNTLTHQVEHSLARCMRMLEPSSAVVALDGLAFVLCPAPSSTSNTDRAERYRQRLSQLTKLPLVACVSRFSSTEVNVDLERESLRRSAALVIAQSSTATVDIADLRPQLVIAELADLVAAHPSLVSGVVDALRSDRTRRGQAYLATLSSWFDAGCDVTRAAAVIHVHRNTFRYRLQRIADLYSVDLSDPLQRFILELQVRLIQLYEKS